MSTRVDSDDGEPGVTQASALLDAATYVSCDDAPSISDGGPLAPASTASLALLPQIAADRYDLADEIARGGLGSVSLARDRFLDRPVAVKQLIHLSRVNRARFLREIKFTARLQHPGIVPIYEAGYWPDGEPFYVMKMVRGRTLAEAVTQATTLDERLALIPAMQGVIDAVAYTHDQRIIHRDIKPQNILIGDFGETALIDWGVAKDLREGSIDPATEDPTPLASDLTVVGAIVGTPAYMPPEQTLGEPIDERADVYALGATLYHVLAGEPPFASGAHTTIAALRLRSRPQPLGARVPGLPVDLASIVDKAMAPRREDRYPSAKELARDVHLFTTGQLIGARQYSRRELFVRWLRRNLRVVGVTTAALVALAVAGVLATLRIVEERGHAEAARAVAEARSNTMTLAQARSALRDDPTEAAAWLASYPRAGADWTQVFALAQVAESMGVARHVLTVSRRECSTLSFTPEGSHLLVPNNFGLEVRSLATGAHTNWLAGVAPVLPLPNGAARVGVNKRSELAIASLTDGVTRRLGTLKAPVEVLALAPNADVAALGLASGDLLLVDLASGTTTTVAGHSAAITGVHVEADGHVLTIAADGALRRSSATGGQELFAGAAGLRSLAVTSDGATAVVGDADGSVLEVELRAVGAPTPRLLLQTPAAAVGLEFGGEDRFLAAHDLEGELRVQERASGQELAPPWPAQRIFALHFAPAGPVLAVADRDGAVRLWNLDTGASAALIGDKTAYSRPAFAPDGRHLALCGMNGVARVWPVPDLHTRVLRGHVGQSAHVLFLPNGRLASDGWDQTVRVWELATGRSQVLTGHVGTVYGLALGPDGQLASAGPDSARVWDLATGTSVVLGGHKDRVRTVAYSPEGWVTGGVDGTIRLWAPDGRPLRVLRGHKGTVGWLIVTAAGEVVSAGDDGTLRLWSLADGSNTILGAGLSSPEYPRFYVDELAGGRRVVACHGQRALGVWSLDGGPPQVFPAPALLDCSRVNASSDGRQVVIPADRDVLVLDVDTGEWRRIGGHDDGVHSLGLSPDGRLVATVGLDRTARLWRLADGAGMIVHRSAGALLGVGFSADSRTLATTGVDGVVWVAPVDEARLLPPDPAALHDHLMALTTAALVPGGGIASPDAP